MKKLLTIILALTLCLGLLTFGAIAADDYYCIAGTMNGWNSDSADRMTDNGDGTYSITFPAMAAGTYEFKFTKNGSWDGCYGGIFQASGVETNLSSPGSNIVFTVNEAADVVIVLNLNTNKFIVTIGGKVEEPVEIAKIKVYITVPASWGDVFVYVWGPEHLGSWSGTKLEGDHIEIPAQFDGMVINNGAGTQSWDIKDIDLTKEAVWIAVGDDGSYTLSYEAPVVDALPVVLENGKYVISLGDLTFAALAEDKSYGYPYAGNVNELAETDYITITYVEGDAFTMQDCYGRYIYMKGSYDSFNVGAEMPEEGHLWCLMEAEGGLVLKNLAKDKYVSYSEQFTSWGCYSKDKVAEPNVLTFTPVADEPTPDSRPIKINVIAPHWAKIYAYTYNPELEGSWPGVLVENGVFETLNIFEGLVLNNGEGQQTADIKDIDLTQSEVWITVAEDNSYTISYEAPQVDIQPNPDNGDNVLSLAIVLMLSVAGMVTIFSKKEN